jgi:hypothetical protein
MLSINSGVKSEFYANYLTQLVAQWPCRLSRSNTGLAGSKHAQCTDHVILLCMWTDALRRISFPSAQYKVKVER